MKKLLITLALLMGIATTAVAGDNKYYVSGNHGDDSYDGSAAVYQGGTVGPWKTMGKAVASVATPGSGSNTIVMVLPFTSNYSFPSFTATPTGGGVYMVMAADVAGVLDLTHPTTHILGGDGEIKVSYCRFAGFTTGSLTFDSTASHSAWDDGVVYNLNILSSYSRVARTTVTGDRCRVNYNGPQKTACDTMSDVTGLNLGINTTCGNFRQGLLYIGGTPTYGDATSIYPLLSYADSTVLVNSRFTFTLLPVPGQSCSAPSCSGDEGQEFLYMPSATHTKIRGCYFDVTANNPCYPIGLKIRYGSKFTSFLSDTFAIHGPQECDLWFTQLSANGGGSDTLGGVCNVTIDSCYFRNENGSCVDFHSGMFSSTVTHSVMSSPNGPVFGVLQETHLYGPNVVEHNTFVSARSGGPVVDFNGASDHRGSVAASSWPLKFRDNIVSNQTPGTFPYKGSTSGDTYTPTALGVAYVIAGHDSSYIKPRFLIDYNVYNADASCTVGGNNEREVFYRDKANVQPAISGVAPKFTGFPFFAYSGANLSWIAQSAQDVHSKSANAALGNGGPDSSAARTTFSAAISVNSAAKGADHSGGDCGAIAYVGTPIASATRLSLVIRVIAPSVSGTDTVTVFNAGDASYLVSGVQIANSQCTVSPTSATIAAGATQLFTFTYTMRTGESQSAVIFPVDFLTTDPVNQDLHMSVQASKSNVQQ